MQCVPKHFNCRVHVFITNTNTLYKIIWFANGLGDRSSILGRVIPKTFKMVLDTSLLNTQHYKVRIESKVEQSRERNGALPYTSV